MLILRLYSLLIGIRYLKVKYSVDMFDTINLFSNKDSIY